MTGPSDTTPSSKSKEKRSKKAFWGSVMDNRGEETAIWTFFLVYYTHSGVLKLHKINTTAF